MRLLEDILNEEDLAGLAAVFSSENFSFDHLAKIAGLSPLFDFCYADFRQIDFSGADLRGFNFTGSDLRKAFRDENTIIDETTVFDSAKIDWIDVKASSIVSAMSKIQAASSSETRQILLQKLIGANGKTDHIIIFMVTTAESAKNIEEFLDFLLFLPAKLSEVDSRKISGTAEKLLKKRMSQSTRRSGQQNNLKFSPELIVGKLNGPKGSLAESIFSRFIDLQETKNISVNNGLFADFTSAEMISAFSNMGRD
ncbi:MAG: pentapeptide repeat-containing protein [Rhizobiaceae bacterium]